MFQCGMNFQFFSLHIAYNFQQLKPIGYFNSVRRFLHVFK